MTRRRLGTLGAGGLLALSAALFGAAGVATAHNKSVYLSCDQGNPVLHISLTYYSTPQHSWQHNTVSASIDGTSVLSSTNFINLTWATTLMSTSTPGTTQPATTAGRPICT